LRTNVLTPGKAEEEVPGRRIHLSTFGLVWFSHPAEQQSPNRISKFPFLTSERPRSTEMAAFTSGGRRKVLELRKYWNQLSTRANEVPELMKYQT
jgi:hypothetical protein